jgi:hypothetical protein
MGAHLKCVRKRYDALTPIANIDVEFLGVFVESRNIRNNNLTILIMALCLIYSLLTLYHAINILFHSMFINSEGLLVPNILDPITILGKWRSHLKSLRIFRHAATE